MLYCTKTPNQNLDAATSHGSGPQSWERLFFVAVVFWCSVALFVFSTTHKCLRTVQHVKLFSCSSAAPYPKPHPWAQKMKQCCTVPSTPKGKSVATSDSPGPQGCERFVFVLSGVVPFGTVQRSSCLFLRQELVSWYSTAV